MKKQKIYILLALLCLAAAGCVKKGELNFKNVKIDNWEPDWALPILNSKLTLKNVVQTATNVTEDANGLYSLHYSSSLFYARASDYILISDQSLNTPAIPLTVPTTIPSFTGSISDSFSNHFNYTDTSGAQLNHIMVSMGTLTFTVFSTFHQNVTATITLPGVTKNGVPLQITTAIVYPATTSTFPIDLAGYTFDLTNGGANKNYIAYKLRFTLTGTGQPITPTDNITASVGMKGIKYSFIDGIMGHFDIPIPLDTIDVAVFNNTLTAQIYLRNPRINLLFRNSIGMGVATKFDNLYGVTNTNVPVSMSVGDISVNGAAVTGQTSTTKFVIDSTNSTIQSMFNPAPNRIIYNGRVRINPPGTTTGAANFVTDSSYISLSADAELPAWFKIIDFALQDTLPLMLPTDTSVLQKAEFKLLMDNAFPLYGSVQLFFVDANYHILDSLVKNNGDDVVGMAPVDNDGKVMGRTSKVATFYMEHDKYNAMAPNVKYCFIRGRLKTSGAGDIKIYSVDNLIVKLAFRFTLNVSSTNL